MEQSPGDMLELEESEFYNENASKGQRLANYFIDLLSFYLLLIVIISIITILTESEDFLHMLETMPILLTQLFGLFLYGFYMAIVEGAWKGRTLGKLITKTRAVHVSGNTITWNDAFWRGLVRMVPFEYFSALGDLPWHDKWTDTRVIKERR